MPVLQSCHIILWFATNADATSGLIIRGPLLENWSVEPELMVIKYHTPKPCLVEYLCFKRIDLDAGPWNFKNTENDVEAQ